MVLELNSNEYEVTELRHTLGEASRIRFRRATERADADGIGNRTKVVYTVNGVRWFAGVVLPTTRRIDHAEESIEYIAADVVEYMGHNPADVISERYNRSGLEPTAFVYPDGVSLEDVLIAELTPLITAGILGALDFSHVTTPIRNLVVRDLDFEGKSWREIIDEVRQQVPVLSFWYDPTTTAGDSVRGGTLRFYDITRRIEAVDFDFAIVPGATDGLASAAAVQCETLNLEFDTSSSYDRITLRGFGDLQERYETLTPDFNLTNNRLTLTNDPYDLVDPAIMLRNRSDGGVDRYNFSTGSWSLNTDAWHPAKLSNDARRIGRAFKLGDTREIVDLKLVKRTDDSIESVVPTMEIEVLFHIWYTGPVAFTAPNSDIINGGIINGVKQTAYIDDADNDFGDVRPRDDFYPDFPSGDLLPRHLVGTPALFEKNNVLLMEPEIRITWIWWGSNSSGDSKFNTLVQETCFLCWPTYENLWIRYTDRSELEEVRFDAGLGYEKHLVLYESRMLKYTDIDNAVIRDDSTDLAALADMVFALLSRPRIAGSSLIMVPSGTVFVGDRYTGAGLHLGKTAKVLNWQGNGVFRIDAVIQSVDLARVLTEGIAEISFEEDRSYDPLELFRQFARFNRADYASSSGAPSTGGGAGSIGAGGGADRPNTGNDGAQGGGGGGFPPPPSPPPPSPPPPSPPPPSPPPPSPPSPEIQCDPCRFPSPDIGGEDDTYAGNGYTGECTNIVNGDTTEPPFGYEETCSCPATFSGHPLDSCCLTDTDDGTAYGTIIRRCAYYDDSLEVCNHRAVSGSPNITLDCSCEGDGCP